MWTSQDSATPTRMVLTLTSILAFQFLLLFPLFSAGINAQQISINRINQMPDFPAPYLMRDWKQVTIDYDEYVFDFTKTGEHLPLIFWRNNTVNYPGDVSFGLHTVVGTNSPTSGEAINVIPALIGATLAGIDKSNQNGYNWVRMAREFFNNRPEENVYLNHPSTESGNDWWYATMPSVFFYQLYDLYPDTDDFDYQLRSVASQWLTAIETMGGSAAPWTVPFMDYRGWYLSTMTPFIGGVKEPEAAGALAWMLYHAYKETGEVRYRMGAEWAMEFLNAYPSNPSYELQLLYGTYIAAKMNAELGTAYDVEKMLNWTFDIGPLRKWGSVVGTWGGLDVSGLIGEVNGSNDYAFKMNTFQQAGALLPLLRYDDRFANALGKWMLNAANASRLFYTEYLPLFKQDSDEWATVHDPNTMMGHEARRQNHFGASPYAMGDAIAGGWGATNLTLYSSSHVGIFGSIIETTDVEGILKLDLLKTDFFRDEAYPTYLVYNPYDSDQTVTIDAGNSSISLYETTTNTFLASGVSGEVQLTVPALSSYIVVYTPAGGTVTYEYDRMLVNGVIVDYMSGQGVSNYPPRIKSLAAAATTVVLNDSTRIYMTAADRDGDNLTYNWTADGGVITGEGPDVKWTAPGETGTYTIQSEVSDGTGDPVTGQIQITVAEKINAAPVISGMTAEPRKIDLGGTSTIECMATDDDDEDADLAYEWSAGDGSLDGTGPVVEWTAPQNEGNYYITCLVSDPEGAGATDSIAVSVRDLSVTQTGNLVLYLPFNGNAADESGNNHAVSMDGPVLTTDRFDAAGRAYRFDGINDYMRVANTAPLNFSNAVTINFWITFAQFYNREQFPISHGSWDKRWKVSLSNNKIRWTINTSGGITDIDSETTVERNRWYNVTAWYSGADMELYIDGKLEAFKYWSGAINPSPVDLTIGQIVPNNNQYNFNGKIDDIRLYDYALPYDEILRLASVTTSVEDGRNELPQKTHLYQNYPNPFNPATMISFDLKDAGDVSIRVYNMLGQEVGNLVQARMSAGSYSIPFDASALASGLYIYRLKTGNFVHSRKMVLIK
ncbi:MAG: T9SS C-terminal target domain-containing protein [Balneolaceae bacterium]|nr:MAG: T9SS C-terminal target domain-containing protein [Balneolaceae bacterium]